MSKTLIALGLIASCLAGSKCFGQTVSEPAHSEYVLGVSPKERQALVALYEATGGSHWKSHDGWLGPAGNECNWYGVTCGSSGPNPGAVVDLTLSENNLIGVIPEVVGELTHLEWFVVFGNHLSGKLPDTLIKRWLAGELWVAAEPSLLSNVSEIDFESASSSVLCARHRIIFRSDNSAALFTEKCRNATPDDRTTFCEVKRGHIGSANFAKLGWLLDKNGFFGLRADYSRNVSDSGFESTRVKHNDKTYEVVNYADAGPFELWAIQHAVEGNAASIEWEKTSTIPACPRWDQQKSRSQR